VYSTCIFCHQSLEKNESIEHFPVGRRLAFDAAKGRLWVICSNCLRWNLTPIEERWEAIEECERLYRGQRLRAQTDEIGLAKLRDGLQLIRIGDPLRPEFAAWRYGDVFGARLRRMAAWCVGGVAVAGAGVAVSLAAGLPETVLPLFLQPLYVAGGLMYQRMRGHHLNLRPLYVPREKGRPYAVFAEHIDRIDLAPSAGPGEWVLNFRHALGPEPLHGAPARRALGILLTRINSTGALAKSTRLAAQRIGSEGGPDAFVARLAETSRDRATNYATKRTRARKQLFGERFLEPNRGVLPNLQPVERLALEMAVHEEDERRALEGELAPLEAAWRDAEEIATIADNLLTPPDAEAFVRRYRGKK
jgi:hypothetical protein